MSGKRKTGITDEKMRKMEEGDGIKKKKKKQK